MVSFKQLRTTCPVFVTLRVIGGKWKPLILWNLREGPMRFSLLMRCIGGITQKMLTQQLREMEADRLIKRLEYSITAYGKTLQPVLGSMADWGTKHQKKQPNLPARKRS